MKIKNYKKKKEKSGAYYFLRKDTFFTQKGPELYINPYRRQLSLMKWKDGGLNGIKIEFNEDE